MSNFWDKLSAGLDLGTFGIELKNWRDLARISGLVRTGASSFLGRKAAPSGTGDDSVTEAKENVMQEGEFLAILAILTSFHMDPPFRFEPITEYQVPASQSHLFNKVVAAMKPGARKLFMSTIGFRGAAMKKRRVVEYVKHEVNGRERVDPVTEETTETVNLDGKRINSAITYLATQGAGPEDERVKRVAETLEGWGIFQSKLDTGKELGVKSADELKRFLAWLDTHAHVVLAIGTLGLKGLQSFMETPAAVHYIAAIEAEGDRRRKLAIQEAFQRALVVESETVNTRSATHYQSFSRRSWIAVGTLIVIPFVLTALSRCN